MSRSAEKAKTIEEVIDLVRKDGYFVTSITEMNREVWSAALRPAGMTTSCYGQGKTALGALKAAYASRKKEDAWNRRMPKADAPQKKAVKRNTVKRSRLF